MMTYATEYELTAVTVADREVIPVLVVIAGEYPAVIEATWSGAVHRIEGRDFLSCLQELRARLEAEDRLLCCQGARGDAGPSGMTRQMSNGRQMYVHPEGRDPSSDDLVDIFAPADCTLVVTVEEQKRRHFEWIRGGRTENPGN